MKRIALVSIFALACATTTVARHAVARHTVATAPYDSHQRDEVWARALGEFQSRGVLVAVSDREGGVLTSQQLATEVPCDDGACDAVVAHQLTLTAGGRATLRTNRTITISHRASIAPSFEAQCQQETNDFLAAITGSPATTFAPPAPPKSETPPAPPKKEVRPSTPCTTYQDCPPGSICSEGACKP